MRTVTKTIEIYTFENAPDVIKKRIKATLTDDGTLYEHHFQERIATLKAVAELLDGTLDYSISVVPDRGEFIRIEPKNITLNYVALWAVIDIEKECPLTGVCYGHDIIDQITKYNMTDNSLGNILNNYLKSIHDEWENMCSDEYLKEHCEANDYEFTDDGRIY